MDCDENHEYTESRSTYYRKRKKIKDALLNTAHSGATSPITSLNVLEVSTEPRQLRTEETRDEKDGQTVDVARKSLEKIRHTPGRSTDTEESAADTLSGTECSIDLDNEVINFDDAKSSSDSDVESELNINLPEESCDQYPPISDVINELCESEPDGPRDLQFAALILSLQVQHGRTQASVKAIVTLVNLAAQTKLLPDTNYLFKKIFEHLKTPIQYHYICDKCKTYIGVLDGKNNICKRCGSPVDRKKSKDSELCFLYMPIKSQLEILFWTCDIPRPKTSHDHVLSDISDGSAYKKLTQVLVCENSVTLTVSFSCDGVPVFKSSCSSLWPVLFVVNELPLEQRRKHVMMAAAWYGSTGGKPNMNTYLCPFVDECKTLSKDGFVCKLKDGNQVKIYVKLAVSVCDSVARPLLQCTTQFNGEYGCNYCLHPGERVVKGNGFIRVYPHLVDVDKRTRDTLLEHGRGATDKNRVFGVKGVSILADLEEFDLIHGFVPDYMHSAILGVGRQFMNAWLDSQSSAYLGATAAADIDKRLLRIRPPCDISRVPRSVSSRKLWKAHEWYCWLLFYCLVVLKDVLTSKKHTHFSLFVEGLYLLVQKNVSKSEVYSAHELFVEFVKQTEIEYGKEFCTFNVHLCEHLAESVLNWGPLWTHSAFVFEDYNSLLLKSIKSSNGVLDQVTKSFVSRQIVPFVLSFSVPEPVQKSLHSQKFPNVRHLKQEVIAIGPFETRQLNAVQRLALSYAGVHLPIGTRTEYCYRILLAGKELIMSKSYVRVHKRNSFVVILRTKEIFSVDIFIIVRGTCYAVGNVLPEIKSFKLCGDCLKGIVIPIGRESSNLTAVSCSEIRQKVVFVDAKRENIPCDFVTIPPNKVEVLV